MISIITTSYNYSNYISETIRSVLAQTCSDWELIIVDDASNDNSIEVIKQFKDERIKLICHNKNKGLSASIQTGLKYAKGEWVAFLESDDFWMPDTLEKRLKIIEQYPEINLIFNNVELFGDENWIEEVQKQVDKTRKILISKKFPKNMFEDFSIHNPIPTLSCVMMKTPNKTFFNSPIDALTDWWLYIHVSYETQAFYLDEKLTQWRIHTVSYIKKPHKPYFCFVNVLAYFDIFKSNRKYSLLVFTAITAIKMCCVRIKVYGISFIRFFKGIFGLKKRVSPLFKD